MDNEAIEVTPQNIKKYKELFNFTIGLNEDFFNITKAFNELVEKNPEAKIKILERIIILNDGEKDNFYIINNGIVSAKVIDNININFSPERNNTEMVPVNKGFLAKMLNWLNLNTNKNKEEIINPNVISNNTMPVALSKRDRLLSDIKLRSKEETTTNTKEVENKNSLNMKDFERF